jgi:hypothetical protein
MANLSLRNKEQSMEDMTFFDSLAGTEATSPVATEPMDKTASFVKEADPAAQHEINQQIRALKQRRDQIYESISNGSATPGEREEREAIDRELDELLALKGLTAREDDMATHAELAPETMGSAVEAFRALVATDPTNVKASLLNIFPEMTDADFDSVKKAYWGPVFAGAELHDIAGTVVTADVNDMGEIMEAVIVEASEKEAGTDLLAFVKRAFPVYGSDDNLASALISHAFEHATIKPKLPDIDPLQHRDPNEIYRNPNQQSQGPHTEDAGMTSMNSAEDVMQGQAGPRQLGKVWIKDPYDGEVVAYSSHFADKAEFEKYVAQKAEGGREVVKTEFPYNRTKASLRVKADGLKKAPYAVINTAEEARDYAIGWQNWMSKQNISWGEVSEWEAYFQQLVERFPELKDEFAENGIIGKEASLRRKADDEESGYANQFFYDEDTHSLKRKDAPGKGQKAENGGAVATEERPVPMPPETKATPAPAAGGFSPLDYEQEMEKELGSDVPPATPGKGEGDGGGGEEFDSKLRKRIGYEEKLWQLEDQIKQLRDDVTRNLGNLPKETKADEPYLIAGLKKLKDMEKVIGSVRVWLFQRDESKSTKYGEIIKHVEEVTKSAAPEIYALLQELQNNEQYMGKYWSTEKPIEKVKVEKPMNKKETWLDMDDTIEVTADIRELLAQFTNWLKKTFLPRLEPVYTAIMGLGEMINEAE